MKFLLKQIRQNIITKKELEDESYNLMGKVSNSDDEEPHRKKKKPDYTDDYKRLISLMMGSHYVSFQSQTSEISFQSNSEKIKETTKRVTGPTAPTEFPDEPVTLSDLPGKPAGDIRRKESKSILNIFYQKQDISASHISAPLIQLNYFQILEF